MKNLLTPAIAAFLVSASVDAAIAQPIVHHQYKHYISTQYQKDVTPDRLPRLIVEDKKKLQENCWKTFGKDSELTQYETTYMLDSGFLDDHGICDSHKPDD